MCGIFGILGDSPHTTDELSTASNKSKQRGPEYSTIENITTENNTGNNTKITLGFHRLAINGLDDESHQPIMLNGCYLVCNGEIYNYKELIEENEMNVHTRSDCEVILHLYEKYGMEYTLRLIDGVFAFILVDTVKQKTYVARDAFGVRPMFWFASLNNAYYGFASEMKQLVSVTDEKIEQFKPGSFCCFDFSGSNIIKNETQPFFYFPFATRKEITHFSEYEMYKYLRVIKTALQDAVKKRVDSTDRPIACLLSGGLDSSLITALVASFVNDVSKLETYSIGLEGSEDLANAQKVADYLGTKHTSIVATEEEFLNAIPEVIYAIESYDTTTVRASVGNFLVAKYISKHSEAKVIFNGDGSDELTGGYLYFHKCPSSPEFDKETRRLLQNIHYFDGLRSDRCISYHGLEARTPFLDRSWVEKYLMIPNDFRNHNEIKQCEKFLLRKAFNSANILPQEVLWRTKEAFSDGVSSSKKSWYETIQEHLTDDTFIKH
jgi:asparagine synthase (glutamine-hydrolysing)